MIARRLLAAALVVAAAGCGKKGPPLAPLRPMPAALSGVTAEREGGTVTVRFTIPAENADGTTPAAVQRVDLYALSRAATEPAPAPAELIQSDNVVGTVPVVGPDPDVEVQPERPAGAPPAPGDTAAIVDIVPDAVATEASVRYYAVAGGVGRRRGPPSPVMAVPFGPPPSAPANVTVTFTETSTVIAWDAAAADAQFIVAETNASGASATRLGPPVTERTLTLPVQFDLERCFVVRSAVVAGAVTTLSAPAAPVCATAVDRFAPPAPGDLRAIGGASGVDLIWTASRAADLGGYLVLRDDGAGGPLKAITPAPIETTQYRDASVSAGSTYTYAVVAVDRATPPNTSPESNRQVVTVRIPSRQER